MKKKSPIYPKYEMGAYGSDRFDPHLDFSQVIYLLFPTSSFSRLILNGAGEEFNMLKQLFANSLC
jgi:hypothetical protein